MSPEGLAVSFAVGFTAGFLTILTLDAAARLLSPRVENPREVYRAAAGVLSGTLAFIVVAVF